MVPEIALTPSVAALFRGAFGDRVAIQHSALSDGERHDQWQRIRRGDVDVVVGTRSAVFAPLDTARPHHRGRRARHLLQAGRGAALSRPRRRHRARPRARGARRARLGDAVDGELSARRCRASTRRATLERRVLDRPLAAVRLVNMREEYAEQGPDVVDQPRRLPTAIEDRLAAPRAGARAAQSPRLRDGRVLPAVRRHVRVPQLQHLADRAHGATRLAGPLSLLQLLDAGAEDVPQVRGAVPRAGRLRHREGRAAAARAVSRGADRPRRSRLGAAQGRADVAAVALRGRRARRARRHADDRQGPRLSARHAGRRDLGRRRPRAGRLPRRGADVPAADAGGRPRRPRRAARRGDRPDALSRALQHPARVPAGLPGVLRARDRLPPRHALSAAGRAGQRRRARPNVRRGDADGDRRRAAARSRCSARAASSILGPAPAPLGACAASTACSSS